jgi:hypothetical protein
VWGVERGRIYIVAIVTAGSGISSCVQTEKVASLNPSPPIPTKEYAAVTRPTKPRIPNTNEKYRLDVIGLDQSEIESRLGPSTQDLQHLPAMEAVFSDGRCTLNVTLYPDVKTHIYHALAYRVASDVDSAEERRRCSAAFAERLHRKPTEPPADTDGPG